MLKRKFTIISLIFFLVAIPQKSYAMHIIEGYLPPVWSALWGVLCIPFLILGLFSIQKTITRNPRLKMLLAMAGAFMFVLSALKIPSITGSCSHPTGTGLGAILFGPLPMSILGIIVLLFQAILLGHGGITTLGANTFSMAIVGPFIAYGVYRLSKAIKAPRWLCIFLAATLGDLLTYITTSIQLGIAIPSASGGITASIEKFLGVFAITQIPLAISEGLLTVLIMNALVAYSFNELKDLKVISSEAEIE